MVSIDPDCFGRSAIATDSGFPRQVSHYSSLPHLFVSCCSPLPLWEERLHCLDNRSMNPVDEFGHFKRLLKAFLF